jgi:inhibitor of cysteine peptidase
MGATHKALAAVIAVALLTGLAGCTVPAAKAARLSDGESGKTVQLAVGGSLVIDLEENASTGYAWQTTGSLPLMLKAAGDKATPSGQGGLVGAAGRRSLTFTAAQAGTGELRLAYARPWEKGVPPAKTFVVTVVVR